MSENTGNESFGSFLRRHPAVIPAAVVIAAFFMPWFSFGGFVSFTGYEMTRAIRAVAQFAAGFENGDTDGVILLSIAIYLVPISALLVILLSWKGIEARYVSLLTGALPLIGFLFLIAEGGDGMVQLIGFGFYLTLIAGVLTTLSAFKVVDLPVVLGRAAVPAERTSHEESQTADDGTTGARRVPTPYLIGGFGVLVVAALVIALSSAEGEIEGLYRPATAADEFIIEHDEDFVLEFRALSETELGVYRLPIVAESTIVRPPEMTLAFLEPHVTFYRDGRSWVDEDGGFRSVRTDGDGLVVDQEASLVGAERQFNLDPYDPTDIVDTSISGLYVPVELPEQVAEILTEHAEYGPDDVFALEIFDWFPEAPEDVNFEELEDDQFDPDYLGPIEFQFWTVRARQRDDGIYEIVEDYTSPDPVVHDVESIVFDGFQPNYETIGPMESEDDFDPLTGFRGPYTYPGGTFPAENVEIQIRWFDPIEGTVNTKFHVFDRNPSADGSGGYVMATHHGAIELEFERVEYEW